MRIFKPTVINIVISIILIFFFVPFIQLSEPECHAFNARPIHGDGPQSSVCLDGARTISSYFLLNTQGTIWSNEHAWLFGWKIYASLNYHFLLLGSVVMYVASCFMSQFFIKQKMKQK